MICSYRLTSPSLTDNTSAACLVSTMLIEECKWSISKAHSYRCFRHYLKLCDNLRVLSYSKGLLNNLLLLGVSRKFPKLFLPFQQCLPSKPFYAKQADI